MATPARHYSAQQVQLTSTGTSDVKTSSAPEGTFDILISVTTNDAYVTFDSSAPSSTNGHAIPKGALPLYLPLGQGSVLKAVSSAAGTSVINVTWINR